MVAAEPAMPVLTVAGTGSGTRWAWRLASLEIARSGDEAEHRAEKDGRNKGGLHPDIVVW